MPANVLTLSDLDAVLSGRIILPTDTEFDDARTLFYGGLDNRPAAIVRPVDADDVATVIRFVRDADVELAVRSGGHGLLGHGGVDGGIVLDLSTIRDLDLDIANRTAWAGAGLTAGEYTAAAAQHGLATGFGDNGSVGLGGLTVGGGIGLLVRKHGLTIDQLLAAEMVTADGEIRLVDEDNHPDLFWAIRGGGSNVGVVTRFRFRLHELPSMVGGILVLPLTAEVVAGFITAAKAAPDELSTIANLASAAPPLPMIPAEVHGQPALVAILVYAGETEAGELAMAPFRELAEPLADLVGPGSYADLFPPEEEEGFHPSIVGETMFRGDVDLATAEDMLALLGRATTAMAVAQLRVLGGAVARVPADATAFAHRDHEVMLTVAGMFEDPSEASLHWPWADEVAAALDDGSRGRYVNFLARDGEDRARAAYPGATWDRLAAIKRTWDPTNLFRRNVNVPPASDGS